MAEHTPGPWTVGYGALDVMAQDDKGPFKVCDIRGWGHFTGKGHGALGLDPEQAKAIQVANANLIAAAPELLAAVKELRATLTKNEPMPYEEWNALCDEVIARADAAMVKATSDAN